MYLLSCVCVCVSVHQCVWVHDINSPVIIQTVPYMYSSLIHVYRVVTLQKLSLVIMQVITQALSLEYTHQEHLGGVDGF